MEAYGKRGKPFLLENLREQLSGFFSPGSPVTILDAGAGTGNFTETFLEWFPNAKIIAADPSDSMIKKLSEKGLDRQKRVRVVQAAAEDLPKGLVGDGTVDVTWISLAAHYILKPGATPKAHRDALAQIDRVVAPEGIVAIRGNFADTVHKLKNLKTFFPEIATVAPRVFPSQAETIAAFSSYGFKSINNTSLHVGRAHTRAEYVNRYVGSPESDGPDNPVRQANALLRNISDVAYVSGLAEARKWAAAKPLEGPVMTTHDLLVFGRRSEERKLPPQSLRAI